MALIPGTLPNDTCYGTPQDLLELFAQYLDVPAFALNSKVVFGTSSAGLTADVVWFDTTTATNPIMKITVSGGFTDYIKNYITSAATVTIVGADSILILDASDSGNTKKGLVSDIAALAVPAAGSITPAQLAQPFTLGTAVTSAGVTSIDFTGIPSWVKRITVLFNGVSTNGTDYPIIQLGDSGGVENTGYVAGSTLLWSSAATASFSTGFGIRTDALASVIMDGFITINKVSSSTNAWVAGGVIYGPTSTAYVSVVGGTKTLSATLDRVRITTVNGSDTIDSGSIVNIMYE